MTSAFGSIRQRADELVLVAEDELAAAIRLLATEHGLIAEGAGAAAPAALLAGKVDARSPAVALMTGRNIALATLARVLEGRSR